MIFFVLFYPIISFFFHLLGINGIFRLLFFVIIVFLVGLYSKKYDSYLTLCLLNLIYIQRVLFECFYAETLCRKKPLLRLLCYLSVSVLINVYVFTSVLEYKFLIIFFLAHLLMFWRFRNKFYDQNSDEFVSWEECLKKINKKVADFFGTEHGDIKNKLNSVLSTKCCINIRIKSRGFPFVEIFSLLFFCFLSYLLMSGL